MCVLVCCSDVPTNLFLWETARTQRERERELEREQMEELEKGRTDRRSRHNEA